MEIILASNSPRRKELLTRVFPEFTAVSPVFEEIIPAGLPKREVPEYFAVGKACSIAKDHPEALVIGSDTIVLSEEEIFGKPKDFDEAFSMLRKLNGKTHQVITGVAFCLKGKTHSFREISDVTFLDASPKDTREYILLDSPLDKAGSYGIQDPHSNLIIQKFQGDFDNIVGLPVSRLKSEWEIFSKTI